MQDKDYEKFIRCRYWLSCLGQVLQGSAKCVIVATLHFSYSALHNVHSAVLLRIAQDLPLEVESLPAEKVARIGQVLLHLQFYLCLESSSFIKIQNDCEIEKNSNLPYIMQISNNFRELKKLTIL